MLTKHTLFRPIEPAVRTDSTTLNSRMITAEETAARAEKIARLRAARVDGDVSESAHAPEIALRKAKKRSARTQVRS